MVKAQSFVRQPSAGVTASSTERRRYGNSNALAVHQVQPARTASVGGDQVQIQMYLSKLKELVPHMPKDRKVSKLEVIQHVIDYICDLQTTLETQPRRCVPAASGVAKTRVATSSADVLSVVDGTASQRPSQHLSQHPTQHPAPLRQPLSLLTSITNVTGTCFTSEQMTMAAADKNLSDCGVGS